MRYSICSNFTFLSLRFCCCCCGCRGHGHGIACTFTFTGLQSYAIFENSKQMQRI